MATRLRKLVIDRVDLVDKGANPDAHILLYKRDVRKAHGPVLYDDAMAANEARSHMWHCWDVFQTSVYSIMESDVPNRGGLLQQSVMQFLGDLMDKLGDMDYGDEMMAKAESVLGELLAATSEFEKAGKMISSANMTRMQTAMKALQEIMDAAMAEMDKTYDDKQVAKGWRLHMPTLADVLKKLGLDPNRDVTDPPNTPVPDDVAKRLTEVEKAAKEAAAKAEALEKRAQEAETKAAETQKRLDVEIEKATAADFVKRASAYPFVGKAEDIAKQLRTAYAVNDETGKALEETFKAANARLEQSRMFEEIGKDTSGKGQTPAERLEAMARDVVAKASGTSYEQAYAQVCRENPDLAQRAIGGAN